MMRCIVELLATLFYLLLPRRRLQQRARETLLQRFFPNCRDVIFFKSGRSALSAVFEALAGQRRGLQVLVPDYICNVVPRAVSRAGLEPVSYRTTECFDADLPDLLEKLAAPSVAGVILASIFGSQNTSQAVVDRIRQSRHDVLLVLDDCQNLVLDRGIILDERTVVVFSFNLKTIAGAMGGGVCLGENGPMLQRPDAHWQGDFRLECAVAMAFLRQVLLRLWSGIHRRSSRRVYGPPGLEYSWAADSIQYDMIAQRIGKVSLARAIIRMQAAAQTESIRKRNFEEFHSFLKRTGAGEIIPTACPTSAPFVPVRLAKSAFLNKVPWKGPYALEGAPHKTLRPELLCFRNDALEHLNELGRDGAD